MKKQRYFTETEAGCITKLQEKSDLRAEVPSKKQETSHSFHLHRPLVCPLVYMQSC